MGEAQYAETASDKDGLLGSVWLRARAGNTDTGAADDAIDLEGDRTLIQAGVDFAQWRVFGDTDRLHLGGMLGYARSDARASANFNPARAKGDTEGTVAGAYATWFANDDKRLGSYLDAWAQYGWFDNRIRGDGLPPVKYDSASWAVSLEYGYALPLGARVVIEPQVQIVYSNYDADRIVEDNGTVVRTLDDKQTLGRLGARLYQPRESTAGLQPFVEVGWWHGDSGTLSFNAVSVADTMPENRYVLNVGLEGILADGWNVWSQLGGEWGGNGYKQVNGQVGVKYSW
jgi:autotransporter family porin